MLSMNPLVKFGLDDALTLAGGIEHHQQDKQSENAE